MDRTVIGRPGTGTTFARGAGPMRVLVTGNQGYLGTVVARVISDAGHEVTGLDTGVFAACVLGNSPPHDPPTLCTDLREVTVTDLAGFDAVVHLAALPDGGGSGTVQRSVGDANHRASVRLARLARAAGVGRFLFASTCEVYEHGGAEPATESSPLRPSTPWAASKLRVEEDIAALADSGFTPVSLRLAAAFGFSPRLRSDLPLNTMVATAALDGRVVLRRGPDTCRPLVHVRDCADAVLRCLEAPAETVHASSFNVVGREHPVTESELARMVAEAAPGTSLEFVRRSAGPGGARPVDCDEIRRAVGFVARRRFADGIVELLHAISSAGVDPDGGVDDFLATFSRRYRPRTSAATNPLGTIDHPAIDQPAIGHLEKVAS